MIGSPPKRIAWDFPTALSTGVNSFCDHNRLLSPVFRHQSEEKGCESKPADQAQTEYLGTVERGVYSGVQSAATSLMMLPLSVATGSPAPMLTGLSGITAGGSLGEAMDKGLPLNQALIHATKQGLIEYCAENKLANISEIVAYAHTDDGKAYRKRIFSE